MARLPTPTHLKLLSGNPGKRPINDDEPKVEKNLNGTVAPKELGYTGKKMWSLCLENSPSELLKSLDYVELMRYCMAYELYSEACRKVKKEGAVILNEVKKPIKNEPKTFTTSVP